MESAGKPTAANSLLAVLGRKKSEIFEELKKDKDKGKEKEKVKPDSSMKLVPGSGVFVKPATPRLQPKAPGMWCSILKVPTCVRWCAWS